MEYTGLLRKYKVNRQLTELESENHLRQKEKFEVDPIDELAVIEMTSAHIEIVDKYYGFKGFLFVFMAAFFLLFVWAVGTMVQTSISQWVELSSKQKQNDIFASVFLLALWVPFMGFLLYAMLKESFTYTHWPVRFNRATRRVHVFRNNRPDGVLSVKWDDVFFCLARGGQFAGIYNWYLCGHVLDKEGIVRHTFAFGTYATDKDILKRQWEYYRRFMAEGKEALPPPRKLLPIALHREGFMFGLHRMWGNFAINGVFFFLFLPLSTLAGIARYFCMSTSRIPKWPQEVLDESK